MEPSQLNSVLGRQWEVGEAAVVLVELLFRMLALGPMVFLGLVYAEAWAASASLGHWPIPSVHDPKSLPTAPLHLLSLVAFLALGPASALFVMIGARRFHELKNPLVWLGLFVVSWAIFFAAPLLDPVTAEWWAD
jgi:hypothetical protein